MTSRNIPDIPRSTPSPARSPRFQPLLDSVAEEILTPDDVFNRDLAEIKEYVKAHGWDAAAMFFGTAVYMGVYYADSYFRVFGGVGRYIVHNLAMGIAANLIAMPFVKRGRLHEGKTPAQANRDAFRYFLLCTVPDSLYQPVQDWFTAVCASGSLVDFEFIQDATAVFSPTEIAASFALFGVSFGLLYLVMKKLLIKHDAEPEVEEKKFDDWWHNFYKNTRELLQSPTWESIKSALQYFIFYLSDYFFDLNMNGVGKTLLNLFGCCAWMAGYSFLFDNLPEVFGYLQINRARYLTLNQVAPESLDEDYVHVTVTADYTDDKGFIFIGEVLDKLVEQKNVETDALSETDEGVSSPRAQSIASTTSTERSSSLGSDSVSSDLPQSDSDVDAESPALLGKMIDGHDEDDLEVIHATDVSPVAVVAALVPPRDPNNIVAGSARLLQRFRHVVSTAAGGLQSMVASTNAAQLDDTQADSNAPYVALR